MLHHVEVSVLSGRPARVFVVDGHPLFRTGVRSALATAGSVAVVGEAATAEDAARSLRDHEPPVDVVLVDLRLPDGSGIDLVRAVSAPAAWSPPPPRVLVISDREDDGAVIAAMRAGARGYLMKDASADELIRAVETVADGGAVLSPFIAARLSAYFTSVPELSGRLAFPELSRREREILDLLARGHDNRRIARILVLSEKTVRNHVSHVFAKLNVTRRVDAMIRARNVGFGA
jgi:DNA-binding NarL/FixJ family response regulator